MDDVHTPTPDEQAAAVERAAVNYRGHIATLRKLVDSRNPRDRRPAHELHMFEQWVPALEAAAATLKRGAERFKEKQTETPPPKIAASADDQSVLDI
jgi:hypothetical protein